MNRSEARQVLRKVLVRTFAADADLPPEIAAQLEQLALLPETPNGRRVPGRK